MMVLNIGFWKIPVKNLDAAKLAFYENSNYTAVATSVNC